MAIFEQALHPLSKFEGFELRYEDLLSRPENLARLIERFLFIERASLDASVIKRPLHRLEESEKALLRDFWSIRPKMKVST